MLFSVVFLSESLCCQIVQLKVLIVMNIETTACYWKITWILILFWLALFIFLKNKESKTLQRQSNLKFKKKKKILVAIKRKPPPDVKRREEVYVIATWTRVSTSGQINYFLQFLYFNDPLVGKLYALSYSIFLILSGNI